LLGLLGVVTNISKVLSHYVSGALTSGIKMQESKSSSSSSSSRIGGSSSSSITGGADSKTG
jgi:hypothetical protein